MGGQARNIIPYTPQLVIRNVESLAKGTGARYLLAIQGQGDELVAKQWKRTIPQKMAANEVLIDYQPEEEPTEKLKVLQGETEKEYVERNLTGVGRQRQGNRKLLQIEYRERTRGTRWNPTTKQVEPSPKYQPELSTTPPTEMAPSPPAFSCAAYATRR